MHASPSCALSAPAARFLLCSNPQLDAGLAAALASNAKVVAQDDGRYAYKPGVWVQQMAGSMACGWRRGAAAAESCPGPAGATPLQHSSTPWTTLALPHSCIPARPPRNPCCPPPPEVANLHSKQELIDYLRRRERQVRAGRGGGARRRYRQAGEAGGGPPAAKLLLALPPQPGCADNA